MKHTKKTGIVILCVAVAVALGLFYFRSQPTAAYDPIPYSLSPEEHSNLKIKAKRGDCDSSFRLAKYYLYGALLPDAALRWLRVAAKSCNDPVVHEYLLYYLIQDKQLDAIKINEVNLLMNKLRNEDPKRAAQWEKDVAEWQSSNRVR